MITSQEEYNRLLNHYTKKLKSIPKQKKYLKNPPLLLETYFNTLDEMTKMGVVNEEYAKNKKNQIYKEMNLTMNHKSILKEKFKKVKHLLTPEIIKEWKSKKKKKKK